MQKLALLKGSIKHYDWGGIHYIPSLLQIENANLQPHAEYWLGVHPQAHSLLQMKDGKEVLLKDFIAENITGTLGKKVADEFGNMPFLLKVLDVKDMLSIQVHPSKKQAAIEFEAENKNGIPLNAANRNYKDANHKPELMVAMSDFYLLHGFKEKASLINILQNTTELKIFVPVFKKEGYAGLYKLVMEMPQEEVNELLQPLVNRIVPLYQQQKLNKSTEDFWAARAAITFSRPGIIDRGIFSIYLFNLLYLKKGEAIFQDAGVPHAYLEGCNVEIMASSDNVLRGGLTTKHIDTAALLKHTKCEATEPKIIRKRIVNNTQQYKAPVKDFKLVGYHLKKNETINIPIQSAEIFLLIDGTAALKTGNYKIVLQPGSIAAAAFAGATITVKAAADAIVFKASAL